MDNNPLKNLFAVAELRNRILFTLGLLAVYRIGNHIPTPGVNTDALALLVRAAVTHGGGNPEAAADLLERAEAALNACDMRLYAAAARYRRGQLMKGTEGASLVETATEIMVTEDIVAPAKVANWLAPGPWMV